MTELEAINGLKTLFSKYELDLPNTDSLEVLHMAINALEKQIAEPLYGNSFRPVITGDTVSGMCPMCYQEFVCTTPKLYKVANSGYCKYCSQRLKW